MRLAELQRLSALTWQVEKHTRKLASVQRRILAILAVAGDSDLTDDVLDVLQQVVVQVTQQLDVLRETLATVRQASGVEFEDNAAEKETANHEDDNETK